MNKKYTFVILIFTIVVYGQQEKYKIRSKYKHLKLVDNWIFQSMETITQAEVEEKETLYKNDDNVETLTFHRSGSMSYTSLDSGKDKKGRGRWFINDNYLRIIADSDTVDATYYITGDILTIIISEEESEEFYGYKNIVRYIKQ